MRDSLQGTIAAFWFVFWTVRALMDYEYLMMTGNGRLFLALYGLAMALGLAFMFYILFRKKLPGILYRIRGPSRCPDCYSRIPKGEEFCIKCGKDLREDADARYCWNCGYRESDIGATSCPKCGRQYKR